MQYDFLIVGAGPFGAAFARTATDLGKTCLVIDKRGHVAGNTYTKSFEGIDVHMYGAHIFHTDSDAIWKFVNRFCEWRAFRNSPRVRVGNRVFSFPINLLTLHQLWGVTTPGEARERLQRERIPNEHPKNAEGWLLAQVGTEIYELFFRGYTKKQWFREPRELPASIVSRLPFRLTFNDDYFHVQYEAIPVGGFTRLFTHMLEGIPVRLEQDFFSLDWRKYARQLVFTGPIDRFYNYSFGRLEYRTLRFEMELHEGDYQGHAVFNYPEENIPFIRSIEHKHFVQTGPKYIGTADCAKTVVTFDYPVSPQEQVKGADPQYPLCDARNNQLYEKYANLAADTPEILFGGRLGEFRYYDIDQAMASAISKATMMCRS